MARRSVLQEHADPALALARLAPADVASVLRGYGEPVESGPTRRLVLGGRDAVWLVAAGTVVLYAGDVGGRASMKYLCSVGPGTILAGSGREPGWQVVGRVRPGGSLVRIPMATLAEARPQADRFDHRKGAPAELKAAIVAGIDRGLTALRCAIPAAEQAENVVQLDVGWDVELPAGSVAGSAVGVRWVRSRRGLIVSLRTGHRYGPGEVLALAEGDAIECLEPTILDVQDTAGLLGAGVLWEELIDQHGEFLGELDDFLDDEDRRTNERLVKARRASEGALTRAARALREAAVPPRRWGRRTVAAVDQPGIAACRIVAGAAGIEVRDVPLIEDPDVVENFAIANRCRTRLVQLVDTWWRNDVGPLVGVWSAERTPVALLWRRGGYDVVDPGTGERQRVTERIAAGIDPTAAMFYRSLPDRPVGARDLFRFGLRGTRADLTRIMLSTVVSFLLGLVLPVITGRVLGVYIADAQYTLLVQACVAVMVVGFTTAAFGTFGGLAMVRLQGRMDATLQAAVWDRLLRLPTSFFRRSSTGEIASAALGISGIRQLMSGVATIAFSAAIMTVVNLALMFTLDPGMALLAIGLVVVHSAAFIAIGLRQLSWQRQFIELRYKLSNRVYQTLSGLAKLRIAAAESFAYSQWADEFVRSRELSRRIQRLQNVMSAINAAYVPAGTLVLYMLLAGPAAGRMSIAEFFSFIAVFGTTLGAVAQATGLISAVGAVVPTFSKLKPILDELPEVQEHGRQPGDLSGSIEIDNVSFRYAENGPLILSGLSLNIRPGEFVAIVGPTGCGKSTLLRLLLGFDKPTLGSISFDRQDLSQLDVAAVRRQCGVVLQNTAPFSGSILDNIRGTGSYTLEEAWEAARMAGLAEDLRKMPMGMHTLLQDGGLGLSGGQRQRLMIAQALIRQPRLLFFDEATSALDNETQRIVAESTQQLTATRVVIAHRLSTIMEADRVVVLTDGKVAESGPPAQLLENTDGIFHRLVQRQLR